jgi:hypothetical protein
LDPATLVAALQLGTLAINTAQQYASGQITQDQAHQQLVSAAANVLSAIVAFNATKAPISSG